MSSLAWSLKLAVLLVIFTASLAEETGYDYYPSDCDRKDFGGTACVLTCRSQDACMEVFVPGSPNLKNFVVKCVQDTACNNLKFGNLRSSVQTYLMCIPNEKSCNSAEQAVRKASFVYCKNCDKYKNKNVNTANVKNGKTTVVFNNGIAVSGATEKNAGIVSNGSFPPHLSSI